MVVEKTSCNKTQPWAFICLIHELWMFELLTCSIFSHAGGKHWTSYLESSLSVHLQVCQGALQCLFFWSFLPWLQWAGQFLSQDLQAVLPLVVVTEVDFWNGHFSVTVGSEMNASILLVVFPMNGYLKNLVVTYFECHLKISSSLHHSVSLSLMNDCLLILETFVQVSSGLL